LNWLVALAAAAMLVFAGSQLEFLASAAPGAGNPHDAGLWHALIDLAMAIGLVVLVAAWLVERRAGWVQGQTHRRRSEAALREEIRRREAAETRQRLLLEAAGEGIFGLDADHRVTFINPAGARMLGYSREALLGRVLTRRDGPAPPLCEPDNLLVQPPAPGEGPLESCLRRLDGNLCEVEFTRAPLHIEGEADGSVVVFSDISARRRSQRSLLLAESVFQHINEGVLVADADGRILRVNRALCAMVGYSEDEIVGQLRPPYRSGEHPPVFYQQLWDNLLRDGLWEGEIWNRRRDGELFPTWQTIVAIHDGDGAPAQFVSVTRDITAQRRSEQRIHRLAYFDNLTGLPNRELFFDRFDHAIQRAQRHGTHLALLFLDLDRFKNVNDTLGHPVGDQLLRAVAERLQQLVRSEDTIARLGGDEFTLLLESVDRRDYISQVAAKVVQSLAQPFDIDGHRLHIGASVGISLYPHDGTDATSLVKHADSAMYQAKAAGRNNFQYYSAALSLHTSEQVALEAQLRRAVKQREFVLHYQPQFDHEARIIGVEALIRWLDPERGLVSPNRFIPMAEETGLIVPIGEWVLQQACRQMAEWHAQGAGGLRVSVNIAGPQLIRTDIVATVQAALDDSGLAPQALELELTETFIMEHVTQTFETLGALRALGVRVAIDDFGTGHSSLATLKRLPADTLKIDRAFVNDLPDDRNDVAIARAILAMSRELDLETVAEGVETEAQRAFLGSEGCTLFQGYLFAPPLPAAEIGRRWITPENGTARPAGGLLRA
jgi:diguanylate cyclase (GGDEF)-like protein/PAS domain S-box-containing protein